MKSFHVVVGSFGVGGSSSSSRLLAVGLSVWLLLCHLFVATVTANDEEHPNVNISIQVSFMAIPYYIAQQKGYFDQVGITTTTLVYPSGAPQVRAAVEEQAWDIGVAGVVPNVIGGLQGLQGIAIAMDQSAINQLVATKEGVDLWATLESVDGVKIAISPNSTGDFVVQACLRAHEYAIESVDWVYAQQDGVIAAMTGIIDDNGTVAEPEANFGGLWAPNTYEFLENSPGSEVLCHGGTVYATVTAGFMVREDYALEHSDLIQKVLAAWLRGIVYMKDEANREELFVLMEQFYNQYGLSLSRSAMSNDLDFITLFDLDGQLEKMRRSGDPPSSSYDFWTTEISEFMLKNGVVSTYPEPIDYITDEYLQLINKDKKLAGFARGEDVVLDSSNKSAAAFTLRGATTMTRFAVSGLVLIGTVVSMW